MNQQFQCRCEIGFICLRIIGPAGTGIQIRGANDCRLDLKAVYPDTDQISSDRVSKNTALQIDGMRARLVIPGSFKAGREAPVSCFLASFFLGSSGLAILLIVQTGDFLFDLTQIFCIRGYQRIKFIAANGFLVIRTPFFNGNYGSIRPCMSRKISPHDVVGATWRLKFRAE